MSTTTRLTVFAVLAVGAFGFTSLALEQGSRTAAAQDAIQPIEDQQPGATELLLERYLLEGDASAPVTASNYDIKGKLRRAVNFVADPAKYATSRLMYFYDPAKMTDNEVLELMNAAANETSFKAVFVSGVGVEKATPVDYVGAPVYVKKMTAVDIGHVDTPAAVRAIADKARNWIKYSGFETVRAATPDLQVSFGTPDVVYFALNQRLSGVTSMKPVVAYTAD